MASKQDLKHCVKDPTAVAALLGLSPGHLAILLKAFKLAAAKDEPIDDADGLYGWLYWCSVNDMKSKARQLSEISDAVLALPDGPSKGRKAASAGKGGKVAGSGTQTAVLVGFRPVEHAEFTFYPTPAFKDECNCEHEDVGIFCDPEDMLLLEQHSRSARGASIRIQIAQGECVIRKHEWNEVDAKDAQRAAKRGVDGTLFNADRIRDEYVG